MKSDLVQNCEGNITTKFRVTIITLQLRNKRVVHQNESLTCFLLTSCSKCSESRFHSHQDLNAICNFFSFKD